MFSINMPCFMPDISFKRNTLYRYIPSGEIDLGLFTPRIVLRWDTISRDTDVGFFRGPLWVRINFLLQRTVKNLNCRKNRTKFNATTLPKSQTPHLFPAAPLGTGTKMKGRDQINVKE